MEQFEQLLTCCVCLDRYRIPKLLPCQHSFCMEPCMEGLVDYVRRQVKCPECRAEHRIPYNGVQAFPTNVTLQRFLELHIEITGELPDPTSGQIMERCGVCSEKSYLQPCAHCEKKICDDCKSAHMDILRREITRFNSQIRRSLHRLQDSLALIEKNMVSLQTNCVGTSEEIDEIYRRVVKAIKDRSDQLKGEIDRYLITESRNLNTLKENLDTEISNINSNCDVVDKYMNETVEWDDCELMDTKEIFLKTVEFLRHFEYENSDYSRRVRFLVSIDPNQLVMNLATFGDLNITPHSNANGSVSSTHLAPPSSLQPGLMRSKSDHRLATQFRQQEERSGYNDEPVLGGRKFGERPVRVNTDRHGDSGSSRYGRGGGGGGGGADYDYDNDYDNDQSTRSAKSRFRSRFVRSHQNEDSDNEQQQQLQRQQEEKKLKDKVRDGEDASRGQLSGIIRLSDCARVIQRLADIGKEKKEKKVDTAAQASIQAAIQAQKASMTRPKQPPPAAKRQVSEDDEISRIKQQNKNAPSSSSAATTPVTAETDRPTADRVSALKRNSVAPVGNSNSEESESSSHNASPVRRTPPRTEVSVNETNEEENNSGSNNNNNIEEEEGEDEDEDEEVDDDEEEEDEEDEDEEEIDNQVEVVESTNSNGEQNINEQIQGAESEEDESDEEEETETEDDEEEEESEEENVEVNNTETVASQPLDIIETESRNIISIKDENEPQEINTESVANNVVEVGTQEIDEEEETEEEDSEETEEEETETEVTEDED